MSIDLETKLTDIQEVAKKNPQVDAAALMISALEQEHVGEIEAKRRRWAYLASVGLPPLGYGIAVYYYFFSDEKKARHTAWWCVGLTTFSIIITLVTLQVIFSSVTQSTGQQFNLQQLQQTPAQLRATLDQ